MSDKEVIHVIVTAPFATNRGYLARQLAKQIDDYGIAIDVSNVPMIDHEPPVDVEKGAVIDEFASWNFSEHHIGKQFSFTSRDAQQPTGVRPPPPDTFHNHGHGIAVCGAPNTGKTTVITLLAEYLRQQPQRAMRPVMLFKFLGDEPAASLTQAEENAKRIAERGIVVKFHVRRSKSASTLEDILASCDQVEVQG